MRGFSAPGADLVSKCLSALVVVMVMLFFTGCVTYIPVDEYNLARTAYESAKEADAARYAPALWFNAEQAYREGKKAFKDRSYGTARSKFNDAKLYSEQAENAARLARHQSGDIIP